MTPVPPGLIEIHVLLGDTEPPRKVSIMGQPGDDATLALLADIHARGGDKKATETHAQLAGTREDWPPLTLSGESPDDPSGGIPVEFVYLPFETSFAELRAMVGPRPFSVTIFETGFGGDGIEELVSWVVEDLAPLGAHIVEMYGYAELARRIGSAQRRRRYRPAREAAETWLIEGGTIPAVLREEIERSSYWSASHLKTCFDLDASASAIVMNELGYRWDAESRAFHRPWDQDAVN